MVLLEKEGTGSALNQNRSESVAITNDAIGTNDGASVLRMMNPTYASPFPLMDLTLEQTIKVQTSKDLPELDHLKLNLEKANLENPATNRGQNNTRTGASNRKEESK